MEEVLHVPGMTSNLVAISSLEDEGYAVTFSRGRIYRSMEAVKGLRLVSVMEAYTD